jgi:hypothetical protein
MNVVATPLPEHMRALFWETSLEAIDADLHCDYVLERAMSLGDWRTMGWLRMRYSVTVLADFVRRKGHRLPPRELAYWALVTGVRADIPTGGGRPAWAGPCPAR